MHKTDKIAIIGYGSEGAAVYKYLKSHGFKNITICDQKGGRGQDFGTADLSAGGAAGATGAISVVSVDGAADVSGTVNAVGADDAAGSAGAANLKTDFSETELKIPTGAKTRLGKNYLKGLEDFDVIFRSPGVYLNKPEIARAKKAGVKITSATKYFFEKCPCMIIGVTGTKGKGTTASLIAKMLEAAKTGTEAELGDGGRERGRRQNLGTEAELGDGGRTEGRGQVFLGGNIGTPAIEFLDQLKPDDIVVLELSSFQLQDLEMSPHIAVVLNTTSEHLDYHKNRAEYLAAKESIVRYQMPGDFAIFNKDYPYWKKYAKLGRGKKFFVSARDVKVKFGDIKPALPGPHNLENIVAAVKVAEILKIPKKIMRRVIETWRGLPHRLEFVAEIKSVKYYNDSFSTTPESCIAAIKSFPKNNMILIAGGSEKFSDYSKLGAEIVAQKNLRAVILIGQTAQRIEDAILKAEKKVMKTRQKYCAGNLTVLRRNDFEEAVFEAYIRAEPNWVVVLSPASASFDMFKNYKERGARFKEIVKSFIPH